MEQPAFTHVPVLAREVVAWLTTPVAEAGLMVDCTVGGGGHAGALLTAMAHVRILGIDRDQEALQAAAARLAGFGRRVRLARAPFSSLPSVLAEEASGEAPAGLLYDLGVSSPQLDRADRGFRYRGDAPLDMRMDRSQALTAATIVNEYSENALVDTLFRFGEERFARRIAHAIVRRRDREPFTHAADLAGVVREAIPAATRRSGPHPARRTFQALRIAVNGELDELATSLPEAIRLARPGARIAVIAYHSLEDRIAKRAFADAARGCRCPPDLPVCVCGRQAIARILTRRPVRPSEQEIAANPRADSARLRVAERMQSGEAA
ncbi:MAG: 16S rRNA (cytosine(1402)-N(4))-methyltransferase RsmH [Actinomycetota bacterium]